MRHDRYGRPVLTPEQIEEIRVMHAEGFSLSAIGRKYDRDHTTIGFYVRKYKGERWGGVTRVKDKVRDVNLPEILKKQRVINDLGKLYKDYVKEEKDREWKRLLKGSFR